VRRRCSTVPPDPPSGPLVACRHDNNGKDPGERASCGVMLESNFLGGAQDYRTRPLVYGRSVTDACLAWEQTLLVLAQLADAVRSRRKRQFQN